MTSSFCFYLKILTQYILSHTVYIPERIWGQQSEGEPVLFLVISRGVQWYGRKEEQSSRTEILFYIIYIYMIPFYGLLEFCLHPIKCCCISVVMCKHNSHMRNSCLIPLKLVTKVSESASVGLGIEFLLKWHLCKTVTVFQTLSVLLRANSNSWLNVILILIANHLQKRVLLPVL